MADTARQPLQRLLLLVLVVVLAGVVHDAGQQVDAAFAPEPTSGTEHPDGYRAIAVAEDGTPVAWDPCATIRWELDVASLPTPSDGIAVVGFMETVSLDARLPLLHHVGTTDRSAADAFTAAGRDELDLPVVVGFGDVEDHGGDARTIGLGGPVSQVVDGRWQHTSGRILLDADAWPTLTPLTQRRVVLHELLHVLGLDHTTAAGQLMAPGYANALGTGDLAGIAALRGDGCT